MARFVSGFAVGFTSVWQLTLVTLAVVPLIALAGGSYAVVMIGLTSRSQKAYSKAGEISEEVCSIFRGDSEFNHHGNTLLRFFSLEFAWSLCQYGSAKISSRQGVVKLFLIS
jgi:hypothetical protein